MGSMTCWRCLARYSNGNYKLLQPRKYTLPISTSWSATFTTSANLSNPPPRAKRSGIQPHQTLPKRGQQTTFKKAKKRPDENRGKPPEPGERRALRKRIVLSNTNALEVQGMQYLSTESITNPQLQGQVIGIPGPLVDQLRAVEAFKVSQSWKLFRQPGMLVREETLEYGNLINTMSDNETPKSTVRRILVGEKGSGKSTLLLQAMSIAFLKNWVVINIPDAMDITNGHTEYNPIPSTSPPQYFQKTYLSNLLSAIIRSNPILSTLSISHKHSLPIPLQTNISLSGLALLGADDPSLAHPIFTAMMTELLTLSTPEHPRPPLLLAIDNLAHAMKHSAYMSASFQPIHAHDLSLIRFFMNQLAGKSRLPNGGIILAATSASNSPSVPTLTFQLSRLEAIQSQSTLPPEQFPSPSSPIGPFLACTGQTPSPIPQLSPFTAYDARVLEVLSNENNNIFIHRVKGLPKEDARGLMEYWAKSGLLRGVVNEGLVGEKWTISGGGVVGELERGCVGMRI